MKRWLLLMLAVVVLLAGCASGRTDVTREEVVAAYEEAGYVVSSRVYDEKLEHGQIAYVQADHPNGDYIYFVFFETEPEHFPPMFSIISLACSLFRVGSVPVRTNVMPSNRLSLISR